MLSMTTASISSFKLFFISAGVVSVAMGIKLSLPVAVDGVPAVWSTLMAWMKPPYLYIIINGIIITIAASTRFHQTQSEAEPPARSEHLVSVKTPPPSNFASLSYQPYISSGVVYQSTAVDEVLAASELEEAVGELKASAVVSPKEIAIESEAETESEDVHASSIPEEIIPPEVRFESLLPIREKPLVSSRFGHRKPLRSNPEVCGARSLRVVRPKKQDTLESTWKAITEGRHVPLTRHVHVNNQAMKSEPSNERVLNPTARIRKEVSVGQEELNRRVEAFIKKFNEEMRMQRQESLNQFMEMINRGV